MDTKHRYPHPESAPGYPHQSVTPMHVPPSYEQMTNQPGLYPPVHTAPPPQQHIHYIPPPTLVVEQSQIVVAPSVGPDPGLVTCPSCRQPVVTRLEYEPSMKTHLCAGILCIFGCWLCCCIPYCVDSCRNANHYCPGCGAYIGTYRS